MLHAGQEVGPIPIGRGDQKRALDRFAKLRCGMDGGNHPKGMGHQNDRPMGVSHSGHDIGPPGIAVGSVPILLDDPCCRKLGLPSADPMIGGRPFEAGLHQDIGV